MKENESFEQVLSTMLSLLETVSTTRGIDNKFHASYRLLKEVLHFDPTLSKQWDGGRPEYMGYGYIAGSNPVYLFLDTHTSLIKSNRRRYMTFRSKGSVDNLVSSILRYKIIDPLYIELHEYLRKENKIDVFKNVSMLVLNRQYERRIERCLANYIYSNCYPRLIEKEDDYYSDSVIIDITYRLRSLCKIL